MEARILTIKCPKCRKNKNIIASEAIEATTEFTFIDGLCTGTNNEYDNGVRTDFHCKNCGHRWRGRKGVTIDNYSEIKRV